MRIEKKRMYVLNYKAPQFEEPYNFGRKKV